MSRILLLFELQKSLIYYFFRLFPISDIDAYHINFILSLAITFMFLSQFYILRYRCIFKNFFRVSECATPEYIFSERSLFQGCGHWTEQYGL